MPFGNSRAVPIVVPKGHCENSPAFQRWVQEQREPRPEGTAELGPQIFSVSRPFGTETTDDGLPALKRRAIFDHPSGMMPVARLHTLMRTSWALALAALLPGMARAAE